MNFLRGLWTARLPGPETPVQNQNPSRLAPSEDPPSKRRCVEKPQCSFTDSTWYAWFLVCETICHQSERDLISLCRVSKAMNDLVTPFLYRSPHLQLWGDTLIENADCLLGRLLDTSHDSPRRLVREITIKPYRRFRYLTEADKKPVSQLIECLPDLRRVRLEVPCSFGDKYMTSIDEHPQKPEIHLLAEDSEKLSPHSLPRVTVLRVCKQDIRSYYKRSRSPLHRNSFLNFITSCPNLKSCSWAVRDPNEKLIGNTSPDSEGYGIHKPFPVLEHLALDGYYIGTQMWKGWQDHFKWSSLLSLELGPKTLFVLENLNAMTGRVTNLRHLKVTACRGGSEELCQSLENFLVSFGTLVDLELLNCFVPIHAITRHTRLVNFCVHIGETWQCLDSRAVFKKIDLVSLDQLCPQLENLELDIERENGNQWPQGTLETLARGFSKLKTLALHSRVGNLVYLSDPPGEWNEHCHSYEPKLTYKAAKEVGTNFFATRHRELNANSKSNDMTRAFGSLQKITLKAGLNKGLGEYAEYATLNSFTFDMLPPKTIGEEPELVHLEREREEKRSQRSWQENMEDRLLKIISIAEDGPRAFSRPFCGATTSNWCLLRRSGPRVSRVPGVGARRSARLAQGRGRGMESTGD